MKFYAVLLTKINKATLTDFLFAYSSSLLTFLNLSKQWTSTGVVIAQEIIACQNHITIVTSYNGVTDIP